MEWTYATYNAFNYCICIGICVVSFFFVVAVFYASKKGKKFVYDRIVGISEDEVDKEDVENDEKDKKERRTCPCCPKSCHGKMLSVLFCLIGSYALGLVGVLLFQSCILANSRVLQDNVCPEYPMDCFIIDNNNYNAISNNVSFHCDPLNKTQFPSYLTNATAQCFGWVASLQTTKNVVDQLGICTGLLGLFSTILAIIVCLGPSVIGIILCVLFVTCCLIAIILMVYYQLSFSALTFAMLSVGIALGTFGLLFYCTLWMSERKKRGSSIVQPTNKEQPTSSKEPISEATTKRQNDW